MRQWSNSRESVLAECERKYCFIYEANARRTSRDPVLRRIADLKSVKSIAMWKGDLLHQGIAAWWSQLAKGKEESFAAVQAEISRTAHSQWHASRMSVAKGDSSAGVLFEHLFGTVTDDAMLTEVLGELDQCLTVFLSTVDSSGMKQEFLTAKRRWIEPLPYGPEATSFTSGRLQVTTKVDLALQSQTGSFAVFDWKTGRDDADHDDQMDLYILWPHLTLGIPLERIKANVVNLRTGSIHRHTLDEFGKRARLTKLHRSAAYLEAILPPDSGWPEILNSFNYAAHISICRRCQFQQLCGELQ